MDKFPMVPGIATNEGVEPTANVLGFGKRDGLLISHTHFDVQQYGNQLTRSWDVDLTGSALACEVGQENSISCFLPYQHDFYLTGNIQNQPNIPASSPSNFLLDNCLDQQETTTMNYNLNFLPPLDFLNGSAGMKVISDTSSLHPIEALTRSSKEIPCSTTQVHEAPAAMTTTAPASSPSTLLLDNGLQQQEPTSINYNFNLSPPLDFLNCSAGKEVTSHTSSLHPITALARSSKEIPCSTTHVHEAPAAMTTTAPSNSNEKDPSMLQRGGKNLSMLRHVLAFPREQRRLHQYKCVPGGQHQGTLGVKFVLSNLRPTCSICLKTFANKYNLRDHFLLHTGEMSHKCPICGNCFRLKRYLRSHKC